MSETKPPNELDELTMPLAWGGPYGASIEPEETRIENDKREKARAEIAQLRADSSMGERVRQDLKKIFAEHFGHCGHDTHGLDYTTIIGSQVEKMKAELAQLREFKEKYQEAMRRLNYIEGIHDGECPWHWWGGFDPEKGTDLNGKWYKQGEEPVCECPVGKAERFIEAEIAAKRFTP